MTWQKCPICDGRSVTDPILIIQSLSQRCACNGTGIINTETGLPPESKTPVLRGEMERIKQKLKDEGYT